MTIKCPACAKIQETNKKDADKCKYCGVHYFAQAQKVKGAEQETTTYPYEFERIFQPKS